MNYLEFEKPLSEIEGKAEELRALARTGGGVDLTKDCLLYTSPSPRD